MVKRTKKTTARPKAKLKPKADPKAHPYEMRSSQRDVFEAVAPELNTKDFRPLNQRYWAQKMGKLQQQVSYALAVLVREGVLILGEPEGPTNTYKLNGKHPAMRLLEPAA